MTKNEISKFSVNELPTWEEILRWYKEYHTKGDNTFNPSKDTAIHRYWKIPEKKVMFALICNQFNKMIAEDGYMSGLLDIINNSDIGITCLHSVSFCLTLREISEFMSRPSEERFNIYNIIKPDGTVDPFVSDHPHLCVNDITATSSESLTIISVLAGDGHEWKIQSILRPHTDPTYNDTTSLYDAVIEYMMTPFKEYFGGEAIGFKENGELVMKHKSVPKYHLGYDPAR